MALGGWVMLRSPTMSTSLPAWMPASTVKGSATTRVRQELSNIGVKYYLRNLFLSHLCCAFEDEEAQPWQASREGGGEAVGAPPPLESLRTAEGRGGPPLSWRISIHRDSILAHKGARPLKESQPFMKFLGNLVEKVCVPPR